MSIQQSLNQALYTTTIAAGLYTHSPQGIKAEKIRNLEKQEKLVDTKTEMEQELFAQDAKTQEEFAQGKSLRQEKAYAKRSSEIANIRKKLYETDPSEKRLASYLKAIEEKRFSKQALKDTYALIEEYKKNQGGNQ